MSSVGKMRYRVKLQSPTNTTDAGGGISQVWALVANMWADIKPVTGTESFRQGQVQESTTHEVIIRYRSDIYTKYRILFGTRAFNIKHIKNVEERNRYLILTCVEGVAT